MTTPFQLSRQRRRRDATDAALERMNPLRGLTIKEAESIFDLALSGNYARLHYIYHHIEQADPVLLTCVERRAAAVSGMGWRVVKLRDDDLAEEQADALRRAFDAADGLDDAIEHLALAFFRGFSFVRPEWDGPAQLSGFDLCRSWQFCRRAADGAWLWNPTLSYEDPAASTTLEEIPAGELAGIVRPRAIDYPALSIYLRSALGERNWGRYLERYGIPPCVLTMPELTSPEDVDKFRRAAENIADALNIAVPYGTGVSMGSEARGADPFSVFLQHQEKLIVLLATGGTLTSLAESGSGTLAGNAQMDVWNEIVSRDAARIGRALDRGVARRIVSALFPGRECLARFELGGDKELEPGEVFDLAAKARAAGYVVAREDLERASGYRLERENSNMPGGVFGGGFGGGAASNAATADPVRPGTADSGLALVLQNASSAPDVCLPPPDAPRPLERVLDDFAENLEKSIYAEMAVSAAEEIAPDGEKVLNAERECRAKDPSRCSVHGTPREHCTKGCRDNYGNGNPETLASDATLNVERGKAVITHIMGRKTGFEPHAMYRRDVGWIGVDYGTPGAGKNFTGGHGISHIVGKHQGAIDGIVDVLQNGTAYKHGKSRKKVFIIKDRTAVVLSKDRDGRLLITDFKNLSDRQMADYTSNGIYHAKGKN